MWGKIISEQVVAHNIKRLTGEEHGGLWIGFDAMNQNPLLRLLSNFQGVKQFEEPTGYYFEEDCEAAIVTFLLDDETLLKLYPNRTIEQIRVSDTRTLINSFPEIYTHYTRKELQIFESNRLMELHIVECGQEVCKFMGSKKLTQDGSIPTGHHLIFAYDPKDGKQLPHNFLATDEQMEEIQKAMHLPLDTSKLTIQAQI